MTIDHEASVQFFYQNIPEEGEKRETNSEAGNANNILLSSNVNINNEHVRFIEEEVNQH